MKNLGPFFSDPVPTRRSTVPEILDDPAAVPPAVRKQCYEELTRAHCWLGNIAAVVDCLRRDPLPVRSVLDIGCGHGALLNQVRKKLGIEGIGVDLHPPAASGPRILQRDAVRDDLPRADVAIAMLMTHHLSDQDVIGLIRNVRRSCRRLIILDLIRHPLPAVLFRLFVVPFVHPVTASDGILSFQRAFTVEEMRTSIERALGATNARLRHEVAPFYIRQIADLSFGS